MAIQIRTSLAEPETDDGFVPHRPNRPTKSEGGKAFKLVSDYTPSGDQPGAIAELVEATRGGEKDQVLLGVTGSGKTFTVAKVIEAVQRPALILAPNKILAAQLYGEFKSFFPENAVEYFVSYYDYYQPEAYVPAVGHLHREGMRRPTSRSTGCATRRRARCWSATTSSSSPRCRASTASARSRPIRR